MKAQHLRGLPAVVLLTAAAVITAGCEVTPSDTGPATLGERAPVFTLADTSGEAFSLETQLESGGVVVVFMPGCT